LRDSSPARFCTMLQLHCWYICLHPNYFFKLPHEDESKNDWAAVEDSEETPRPGSLHTDYSVIVRPPLRDEVIPLAAEVIGSHILVAGLGKVALAPEAVARDLIAANVPFERLEVHASTRLL
jgi:hypothetical protein